MKGLNGRVFVSVNREERRGRRGNLNSKICGELGDTTSMLLGLFSPIEGPG